MTTLTVSKKELADNLISSIMNAITISYREGHFKDYDSMAQTAKTLIKTSTKKLFNDNIIDTCGIILINNIVSATVHFKEEWVNS